VRDGLPNVAVLLRGPGRIETIDVEVEIDD